MEVAHRSITICHLGNIAMRLGRETLRWDPRTERIIGDDEAAEDAQPALPRPVEAAGRRVADGSPSKTSGTITSRLETIGDHAHPTNHRRTECAPASN